MITAQEAREMYNAKAATESFLKHILDMIKHVASRENSYISLYQYWPSSKYIDFPSVISTLRDLGYKVDHNFLDKTLTISWGE